MKTNARMFAYEKYCEEILKAGLTEVSVHFYSGEARIHDSFTKVRGSYQQAMAGVKNILNFSEKFFPYNSCSVNLALVVCRENIRTLQKIIFPMLELGINQLFFVANPTLLGDDTEILSGLEGLKMTLGKNNISYYTIGIKENSYFYKPYLTEEDRSFYKLF